jgi:L-ascorbate metabolism protein UlaG (beta-lactamase superfamily)
MKEPLLADDAFLADVQTASVEPHQRQASNLINGKLGNVDAVEAARLAHEAGAKLAVPCHFDMVEFNTTTRDEFVAECKRLGQPYRVLQNGERLNLD